MNEADEYERAIHMMALSMLRPIRAADLPDFRTALTFLLAHRHWLRTDMHFRVDERALESLHDVLEHVELDLGVPGCYVIRAEHPHVPDDVKALAELVARAASSDNPMVDFVARLMLQRAREGSAGEGDLSMPLTEMDGGLAELGATAEQIDQIRAAMAGGRKVTLVFRLPGS